ncbi:NAD(P)-binding protein [Guyanagaster necrorhizus]|uniref:NAD(P)-binding protein n=1 Tax=Guyanagaster necrorhizus TaxID=856835 RepID=A0A9P8AYF6_9AGAR|nr:NAD(P)-binding protein [Guyanagaster necrorhizus MCA 3950]KAG7452450.1 NAD(P)-binding protein [Guyanagaster necrorhizus MCA 3950]
MCDRRNLQVSGTDIGRRGTVDASVCTTILLQTRDWAGQMNAHFPNRHLPILSSSMSGVALKKILVVGGNGFIGSAVCRAALAKGMQVTSVSSSGRPYRTPKGHSPTWTEKESRSLSFSHEDDTLTACECALQDANGVVHTLGTLLDDGKYKTAVNEGSLSGLVGSLIGSQNPLEKKTTSGYESLNRDAALRVCEAFVNSGPAEGLSRRPFVYISAEDIFRPIIPARYIETKREAEAGIDSLVSQKPGQFRGVYIRPSLVYHAHFRPLSTPFAALLEFSAVMHSKVPRGIPTPSSVLRSIGSALAVPEVTNSMSNALTIPPIHVDHVAEAVCVALENDAVSGAVGVREMREMIGWMATPSDGSLNGAH